MAMTTPTHESRPWVLRKPASGMMSSEGMGDKTCATTISPTIPSHQGCGVWTSPSRAFTGLLSWMMCDTCAQRLNPRMTTPTPTKRMASHSRGVGRSWRNRVAKTATSRRLSLSIAATFDASPICKARK
jgi:hypothetical protein